MATGRETECRGHNGAVYNQEVGNQLGFWTADAQPAHSRGATPEVPILRPVGPGHA
jgi:hypothetical protein